MGAIVLVIDGLQFPGTFFETPAAEAISAHLPIAVRMERWGDEYYGALGTSMGPFPGEQAEELEIGDLAYWEPGNALCLFFGPTPVSRSGEPRAASPVHHIGAVTGDWAKLRSLGKSVRVQLSAHL